MGHDPPTTPTTPDRATPAPRRSGRAALYGLAACVVAFEGSQLAFLLAAAGVDVDVFDLVAARAPAEAPRAVPPPVPHAPGGVADERPPFDPF